MRRPRRPGVAARRAPLVLAGTLALLGATACGSGSGGSSSPSAPAPDAPIIVTFEVVDERFKALLTQPEDIAIARRLLLGEDAPGIPNGRVVRETGVNDGWSWSLDPDDIEFAEVTIEVCDGLPSDVEAGTVTSDRYCPWSALVVEIVAAP
jgi:hypothetical protein